MGSKLSYLERAEKEYVIVGEFGFICLLVFTGVDMFAHLDLLISKTIAVKDFVLRFYGSLPYLEKELDFCQLSSQSRGLLHSGSRTGCKVSKA